MQTIRSFNDLTTYLSNNNPGNVGHEHSVAVAEAIRRADGCPAWGEDWEPWLDRHAAPIALAVTATFEPEAQENIRETGCDPISDVVRLVSGGLTREALLEECLDGADGDRVAGWRSYVATVANCAA